MSLNWFMDYDIGDVYYLKEDNCFVQLRGVKHSKEMFYTGMKSKFYEDSITTNGVVKLPKKVIEDGIKVTDISTFKYCVWNGMGHRAIPKSKLIDYTVRLRVDSNISEDLAIKRRFLYDLIENERMDKETGVKLVKIVNVSYVGAEK